MKTCMVCNNQIKFLEGKKYSVNGVNYILCQSCSDEVKKSVWQKAARHYSVFDTRDTKLLTTIIKSEINAPKGKSKLLTERDLLKKFNVSSLSELGTEDISWIVNHHIKIEFDVYIKVMYAPSTKAENRTPSPATQVSTSKRKPFYFRDSVYGDTHYETEPEYRRDLSGKLETYIHVYEKGKEIFSFKYDDYDYSDWDQFGDGTIPLETQIRKSICNYRKEQRELAKSHDNHIEGYYK